MVASLDFLPSDVLSDPTFQLRWRHAVMQVRAAVDSDKKTAAQRKKAILTPANRSIGAAQFLLEEIDRGGAAGLIAIDSFAHRNGFCSEDVVTVRRFLNLLAQDAFCLRSDSIKAIPGTRQKEVAPQIAGYFAGRLCAEFGRHRPTSYAGSDHGKESDSIQLTRGLLIESGARYGLSTPTLKRATKSAKEGFDSFIEIKSSSAD